MKKIVLFIGLFAALQAAAQTNFTYTPEKPKPGDVISFSYTPGGDLEGVMAIPEAYAIVFRNSGNEVMDITLKREYGKLVGTVKTDTSTRTVAFGFTKDDKFDNNQNKGYIVQLYDGDLPLQKSFADAAAVYTLIGEWKFGMKSDLKAAMNAYEKMFELYPESKQENISEYLMVVYRDDKVKGSAAIQKEIENSLRAGLNAAKDYDKIVSFYYRLGLPQQATFMSELRNEKFPNEGGFDANKYYEKYMMEPDLAKKEAILQEVETLAAKDKNADKYASFINFSQRNITSAYAAKEDWSGFQRFASKIKDERAKAILYNNTAWEMQEDSTNLKLAEELSRLAVNYGKADWKNPKGGKPKMQRYTEWIRQKEKDYATYADTYAMVLYRMGNYKKALTYAKEANVITKGLSADHNNTYVLIAEKSMKPKQYKALLEKFVKDGKANTTITDILKKVYIKDKKSEDGFEAYLAALEKEAYIKLVAELKKEMLNDEAPQFTLNDLDGAPVSMSDLKDKVVILDFWATWCGPCIASMPGMKKMVNKYQDDPNVKFLFVDTWQNEDDEIENARKFIEDKGYKEFHVLMDMEDKVVSSFKVSGIPTKFVIGKDGRIKFMDVGFGGEEMLMKKLDAMIDLAKGNE